MQNETEMSEKSPAREKEAKTTVNYGPGIEGQDCLACNNFKEPDRCSLVKGEISPTGACDLWESPTSIQGLEFGDSASIEDILFGPGDA